MATTLGEQQLAVINMAERAATSHRSMTMGPKGPSANLRAKHVRFSRGRTNGQLVFRIALHGGLILDVKASIGQKGMHRVIGHNIPKDCRMQEGYPFELKSTLAPGSTNPGGYHDVQTYRYLLREDGYIHTLGNN